MKSHKHEIKFGDRFAFGDNWSSFLNKLDNERITEAELSLKNMLDMESLEGKRFLDIGSGSGLFSMAARRLGASVVSFDYDPSSVRCTLELKKKFFPDDKEWIIEEGSIIDDSYTNGLGMYDIVYSWGVLHHTGAMYIAFQNAINRVEKNGVLYIAIYNDQKWKSHLWWLIKLIYNKLPEPLNKIYAYSLTFMLDIFNILKYTIKLKPMVAIKPLITYKKKRGMSRVHDIVDWIGGFPYEFATHDNLRKFFETYGFELVKSKQATSLGCHEMVFKRI